GRVGLPRRRMPAARGAQIGCILPGQGRRIRGQGRGGVSAGRWSVAAGAVPAALGSAFIRAAIASAVVAEVEEGEDGAVCETAAGSAWTGLAPRDGLNSTMARAMPPMSDAPTSPTRTRGAPDEAPGSHGVARARAIVSLSSAPRAGRPGSPWDLGVV